MQWKTRRNRSIAATTALGLGLITVLTGCGSSHKAATPKTTSTAPPISEAAPTSSSSTAPPSMAPATTAPVSPAALVASALANGKARQSVHIVVSDHFSDKTGSMTDDAAVGRGQQTIMEGAVSAAVIWVNNVAYIRGNADAVTNYFGFSAAEGPMLAAHWVSIPPTNGDYAAVTDAVGIGSALQEDGLKGPFNLLPATTKDGQRVVGVHGVASSPDYSDADATLYVTDGPSPLPVEFDNSSSQGTEQVVFSSWGETVTLTAPSGAVPITSVPDAPGS